MDEQPAGSDAGDDAATRRRRISVAMSVSPVRARPRLPGLRTGAGLYVSAEENAAIKMKAVAAAKKRARMKRVEEVRMRQGAAARLAVATRSERREEQVALVAERGRKREEDEEREALRLRARDLRAREMTQLRQDLCDSRDRELQALGDSVSAWRALQRAHRQRLVALDAAAALMHREHSYRGCLVDEEEQERARVVARSIAAARELRRILAEVLASRPPPGGGLGARLAAAERLQVEWEEEAARKHLANAETLHWDGLPHRQMRETAELGVLVADAKHAAEAKSRQKQLPWRQAHLRRLRGLGASGEADPVAVADEMLRLTAPPGAQLTVNRLSRHPPSRRSHRTGGSDAPELPRHPRPPLL